MLINSKSWKESWSSLEDLNGGGQGTVKKVQHKETGKIGFLKILNKQGDAERRARFYREATAYDSCTHQNLPILIESNAHNYSDNEYKVYIVTEFIDGMTLTQLVDENRPLCAHSAAKFVRSLIDTIQYCHDNGWVHRDIKPDNIIINDTLNPILLDFGMAFKVDVTPHFSTETGQEVGNRFLRLPELRADSPVKQDIRSDLSFIGAIYFYLLTSIAPVSLKDENGKMPHQRVDALKIIKEKCPNSFIQIMALFDKAFSEKISGRFISAENFKDELMKQVEQEANPKKSDIEEDLRVILGAINSEANIQMAENKQLYDSAMNVIKTVHFELGSQFMPTYKTFQSGYVSFSDGLRNILGFCHFANQDVRFAPNFLVKIIGEELVVYVDDTVIYRTELISPNFTQEFRDALKEIYIKGMRNLVEIQAT